MRAEKLQQKLRSKLFITRIMKLRNAINFLYLILGIVFGIAGGIYIQQFLSLEKIYLPASQWWLSLQQAVRIEIPSPQRPTLVSPPSSHEAPVLSSAVGSFASEETRFTTHKMDDSELFWRASMVPMAEVFPFNYIPKVAFMFLTKGPLPLAPLWERFFEGHSGSYSIYVHSHPDYIGMEPQDSVFYRRRIPSQAVQWGKSSMIDAERRLLANALLDFTNDRFVLLSESCIPLFNFTTVYGYLMNSNHTFVEVRDDPSRDGRGRYNKTMFPTISISQWRKGSQWFEVTRKVAVAIVSDSKYYPVFAEHCHPRCYSDEHYIPTLVNLLLPGENSNKSITWVDWPRPGPHPARYAWWDVNMEFLNRLRFVSNCSYNGKSSSLCFMFARKFVPNTLKPLLQLSPILFG